MMTSDEDQEIVAFVAAHPVLRDLIDSLTDGSECWFDHHGGCQEHGYLSLEPGELCPHEEVKRLLKNAG